MLDITLQSTLLGHQNPVYTIAVDTQKNLLYSAGNDKGIVEWDLETYSFKRIVCSVPSSVYQLSVIEDQDLLIIALRVGGILVVKKSTPELVAKLEVERGAVFVVKTVFSKNEIIAVDEFGKAYVWSATSYELLYTFQITNFAVRSLELIDNEKYLAVGDKNGFIYILDTQDYHIILSKKIHEQSVTSLAYIENFIISGGRDAKMYKLNLKDLSIDLEIVPHMFTIYGIEVLADQQTFATISRDKTLKIWNTNFKLLKNISKDKGIESHHLSINTIAFNAVTQELFTSGDDKLIKVWRIQ